MHLISAVDPWCTVCALERRGKYWTEWGREIWRRNLSLYNITYWHNRSHSIHGLTRQKDTYRFWPKNLSRNLWRTYFTQIITRAISCVMPLEKSLSLSRKLWRTYFAQIITRAIFCVMRKIFCSNVVLSLSRNLWRTYLTQIITRAIFCVMLDMRCVTHRTLNPHAHFYYCMV